MYLAYFGLDEAPFSITPDPSFIYLSGRHRDALAHLLHGVGQGGSGGFVQLTGEVGTGKTTLCRALLEQVPAETHIALVLNPLMNPLEMLAAVCEELGIPTAGAEQSAKTLVDRLNGFLLEAHARGERVVLVIDEAQNLSIEALEQVRLLTNLETSKDKLLQIILLGQPELRELLQRRSLRQLAQRITARYHLTPLGQEDTTRYVGHRLAVAGAGRNPFEPAALKALYQRSQGVPRLVNIIADRALAGAYAAEQDRVTARLVHAAADEVQLGEPNMRAHGWPRWAGMGAAAVLVLALGWFTGGWLAGPDATPAETAVAPGEAPRGALLAATEAAADEAADDAVDGAVDKNAPAMAAVDVSAREALPATDALSEATGIPAGEASVPQATALQADAAVSAASLAPASWAPDAMWYENQDLRAWAGLAERWGREQDSALLQASCQGRSGLGFACLREQGNWARIRQLGLPVVLVLNGDEEQHLLLNGMDGNRLRVGYGAAAQDISRYDIEARWLGDYYVAWPQAPEWPREVARGDAGEPVDRILALASRTADPYTGAVRFDGNFEQWLKRFQLTNGLEADGIVGPQTLLYLMRDSIEEPRLLSALDGEN